MTESEARPVMLLRAFETTPNAAWSEVDAAWASREALRVEGEQSSFEQFLVRRAELGKARLARHDASLATALRAPGGRAWLGWVVVLGALVLGWSSESLGAARRINILAPPLLAVLVWNLAVYLALALGAFRWLQRGTASAVDGVASSGPLRQALLRLGERFGAGARVGVRGGQAGAGSVAGRTADDPSASGVAHAAAVLGHFLFEWNRARAGLHAERLAAVLHAAAAVFAIGALASLYVRGLAFEYRAGWESTFLTPDAVHGLI